MMALLLGLPTLLVHALLMLLAAPLVAAWPGRVGARLAGRANPALAQPWRDLRRLLRKDPVLPESASTLVAAMPFLCLALIFAASLLVPSFTLGMASAKLADLLALVFLLALARALLLLAAIDGGAPFGGAAAGLLATRALLVEPALLLVILAVAVPAGSSNLDLILAGLREGGVGWRAGFACALAALVALALADTGRLGFTDRRGALDLAAEYSGPHLAALELAGALRLTLWLSLLGALLLPESLAPAFSGPLGWALGLAGWAVRLLVLATALGVFEALTPTLRAAARPGFLAAALLFGVLAALLLGQGSGGA